MNKLVNFIFSFYQYKSWHDYLTDTTDLTIFLRAAVKPPTAGP